MKLFDIKRGSVNDGKGIRTVFFFKGCPLRCAWCHNPESFHTMTQLGWSEEKCKHCGVCEQVCPIQCHEIVIEGKHFVDYEKCIKCGKCVDACPFSALAIYGFEMTVEEAIKEAVKDKNYYEISQGGITFSGGEPMMQFEEVLKFAKEAQQLKLSVCMETSGYGKTEHYKEIAQYIDCFLFDVKVLPELYPTYTGQSMQLILENLHMLSSLGASIVLRCPIIPDVNFNDEHFRFIAELALSLNGIIEIDLLPYHPIGLNKYDKLGVKIQYSNAEFLDKKELEGYQRYLEVKTGLPIVL